MPRLKCGFCNSLVSYTTNISKDNLSFVINTPSPHTVTSEICSLHIYTQTRSTFSSATKSAPRAVRDPRTLESNCLSEVEMMTKFVLTIAGRRTGRKLIPRKWDRGPVVAGLYSNGRNGFSTTPFNIITSPTNPWSSQWGLICLQSDAVKFATADQD